MRGLCHAFFVSFKVWYRSEGDKENGLPNQSEDWFAMTVI